MAGRMRLIWKIKEKMKYNRRVISNHDRCNRCKVGGNGDAKGAKLGINKMRVKHNQGKIYMNRKHMVAGSEGNKRQDFTINGNRVRD